MTTLRQAPSARNLHYRLDTRDPQEVAEEVTSDVVIKFRRVMQIDCNATRVRYVVEPKTNRIQVVFNGILITLPDFSSSVPCRLKPRLDSMIPVLTSVCFLLR